MRELFHSILSRYLRESSVKENFKSDNRVISLIEHDTPTELRTLLQLDKKKYSVEGSAGIGKWTHTPWISMYNTRITNTATRGFYIVYLFRKDMTGLYLSLNQGTEYLEKKFKGHTPRTKMRSVAQQIRQQISFNKDFDLTEIDLKADTNRAKNYEAAHIIGKFYSADNIPSNDVLLTDLVNIIQIYDLLEKYMGTNSIEQVVNHLLNLELIEDIEFQTDVQLSDSGTTPEQPHDIPQNRTNSTTSGWARNPAVAKESLILAKYTCEIDPSHITFTSSVTGENFVEAHHLIPMKNQSQFRFSLDVPGNVVSLCPTCHRILHHAVSSEKAHLIRAMLMSRRDKLIKYGIDISQLALLKMYE